MKKIITLLLSACLVISLFAEDVKFSEARATDVRSMGMGGSHLSDYSDYFTLFRNPSLLKKAGKHWYWDNLTVNIGGPFDKVSDLQDEFDEKVPGYKDASGIGEKMSSLTALPTDQLFSLISSSESMGSLLSNGINLNLTSNLPFLSFGGTTKKGFGWGVYDRSITDALINPTLYGKNAVSEVLEIGIIFGYGTTVQFSDTHALSVGGSARVYEQALAGADIKLVDLVKSNSNIMDSVSLNSRTVIALDVAATYTFSNWFDASLVCNNALSPSWSSSTTLTRISSGDFSELSKITFDKNVFDKSAVKLGAGVGLKVPTWWSFGILSSFKVYIDDYNVLTWFGNALNRNPWLDVGIGTELSILRLIELRAGLYDGYLNAGVGINLGPVSWDFAIYGKELSNQPGGRPQLNMAFAMSLQR